MGSAVRGPVPRGASGRGRLPLFFAPVTVLSVPFRVLAALFDGTAKAPFGLPAGALMSVRPVAAASVLMGRQGGVAGIVRPHLTAGGSALSALRVHASLHVRAAMTPGYGLDRVSMSGRRGP